MFKHSGKLLMLMILSLSLQCCLSRKSNTYLKASDKVYIIRSGKAKRFGDKKKLLEQKDLLDEKVLKEFEGWYIIDRGNMFHLFREKELQAK